MKALILAAEGFEDSELLVPLYRLREEGIKVDIAAPRKETFAGKHGYEGHADLSFAQLTASEYDVLVLPGGKGPEAVRLDERAVKATREIMTAGKVVASICHGAQVLISAGVLEGRQATCWKGIRDDLRLAGAEYLDQEVVVDDNLITSRQPGDLPAFCREMMKAIENM